MGFLGSSIEKIKNFLSRFLVYHMVLLWLYMKVADIEKSTTDFKNRISKSLVQFNLKGGFFDYLQDDPFLLHLLLILSESIWFVLAIFGSKLGAWFLCLHFSFTTLLFFNPFLPENSFSLFKFDIRPDMLSSFGVACCFYILAYYPNEESSNSHYIAEIDEDSDDEQNNEEEIIQTNQHSNVKSSKKVSSKKAKSK